MLTHAAPTLANMTQLVSTYKETSIVTVSRDGRGRTALNPSTSVEEGPVKVQVIWCVSSV